MAVSIDPDGVVALSAATSGVAAVLQEAGANLQTEVDRVDHLVGRRPVLSTRTTEVAGDLAEVAGWAHQIVIRYVDDERPLRELATLGFWLPDFSKLGWDPSRTAGENIERAARSDEAGAFVLGTAGALLERYRRFALSVPRPGVPLPSLALPAPDDVWHGRPYVRAPSGLLVPQGVTLDPYAQRLAAAADDWYPANRPTFVTDPGLGRPPTWARTSGRALGVLGTGLTLYDSYASQWEHDATYHPEWGTGERVASAAYNTATEGGGAVAGGLIGAKIGAAAGSFIPIPVVGTVGGAIVGGAIGAFVGSKAGKAVGRALKEGAEALGDKIGDAWNSVFG
jgi:hypothetical protein